jgi:hypothetical protein
MMKPRYLDQPGRWQYAPRVSQSQADYGCAIERRKLSGYAWHDWAICAVFAIVLGMVAWGVL